MKDTHLHGGVEGIGSILSELSFFFSLSRNPGGSHPPNSNTGTQKGAGILSGTFLTIGCSVRLLK